MAEGYFSTHRVNDSAGRCLLTIPLMTDKKHSGFNQSSLII